MCEYKPNKILNVSLHKGKCKDGSKNTMVYYHKYNIFFFQKQYTKYSVIGDHNRECQTKVLNSYFLQTLTFVCFLQPFHL